MEAGEAEQFVELLSYGLKLAGFGVLLFVVAVTVAIVGIVLRMRPKNPVTPFTTDRFSPGQVQVTAERITGTSGQGTLTIHPANIVRLSLSYATLERFDGSEQWMLRIEDRDGTSIWVDGFRVWPASALTRAKVQDADAVRLLLDRVLTVLPPSAEVEPRVRLFAVRGEIE